MDKKEIIKKIAEWWDSDICSGKPHCTDEGCDLCINCLDDLLKKFGGEWNHGTFKLRDKR